MGVNDSIFCYDFAKVYRLFKFVCREYIVPEDSFEKTYKDDIVRLLLCLVEHTDFSKFLKQYNKYRLRDQAKGNEDRVHFIMSTRLTDCVGQYVNTPKHMDRNNIGYTCFLLDGILQNMRSWKP